jgi:CheY-like chemotaxis protein
MCSPASAIQDRAMSEKILFVDDEPAFLTSYQLMLPQDLRLLNPGLDTDSTSTAPKLLDFHTAVGGAAGLAAIQNRGPYSLIISDMRMPGMNGLEFLTRVQQAAPETVRMLLTGYSDIEVLMNAVNRTGLSISREALRTANPGPGGDNRPFAVPADSRGKGIIRKNIDGRHRSAGGCFERGES